MVKISELNLLNTDGDTNDISLLLEGFNATKANFPKNKMVHELFEAQAKRYPNQVALQGDNEELTYQELSEASGRIASFLRGKNVEKEEVVALLMGNSVSAIVAILGILKAGAAYLPISPSDPYERIKYVLSDAKVSFIISEKKNIKALNRLQWECSCLKSLLCMDSRDIYAEQEELNELMQEGLWDFVGKNSHDDISGGAWHSSYTGEDFSREAMDEYAANILEKLSPYLNSNSRVLEIGCASGISMFKIAPLVKEYVGTDLSSTILEKTEEEVRVRNLNNITLHHLAAHDIDYLEGEKFDIVIFNSVIQCFNGHNYLRDVLRKTMSLFNEQGTLFFGDIQDLERKEEFLKSLEEFRLQNEGKQYKSKLEWSNELFLSKEFIDDLQHEHPAITAVSHSEKIGTIKNELTAFRFDSILRIDKSKSGRKINFEKKKLQYDYSHVEAYLPKTYVTGNGGNLAYIIYTSGSTGFPKGCLVTHENVVRLIVNDRHPFAFGKDDVWILSHPINFDFSVWEIFGSLLYGARLIVPPREHVRDANKLVQYVESHKVTVFNQTPLAFRYFIHEVMNYPEVDLSTLRYVIFGGDKLDLSHLKPWVDKFPLEEISLINMYGITETTVHVSFHSITYSDIGNAERSPVGKPLPETKVYILNNHQKLVPIGVVGEVYVGGSGVCRGYLNQAELTAEKFIGNPFEEGSILYRSGDMGRWLKDGKFEIIGRKDQQVKIRGYRVEPSEISKAITGFPLVNDALVITNTSLSSENELVAYVVAKEKIDLSLLRTFLSGKLAEYMIPAHLVQIDCIPLTPNGKLDKKKLPDPIDQEMSKEMIAPTGRLEVKLHEIWKEVLDRDKISVKDNFFDLGGHSLKATKLVSKIYKDLNIKIELRDVFLRPTIAALAEEISGKKDKIFEPIPKSKERGPYRVSHSQKRIWILSQWEERQIAYNMPEAYRIKGNLQIETLRGSFEEVIRRHESLRTIFIDIDGEIRQKVLPFEECGYLLEVEDLMSKCNRSDFQSTISEAIALEAKFLFDLAKGPLVKTRLLRTGTDEYVLLLTVHHIVSDGWSMGVFINEVTTVYHALLQGLPNPLQPLSIQYKDFSEWQNKQLEGGNDTRLKKYWNTVFKGKIPVLDLLTDYPRPAIKTFNGSRVGTYLDDACVRAVKAFANETGTSVFMVLLTAVKLLLHKYSGQQDLIVGMPVTGRDHPDLEKQIGFYVNTLALRTKISPEDSFEELLKKVKSNVIDAFDYQQYPFDKLVEDLDLERDLGRTPLFDVMIQYLTEDFTAIKKEGSTNLFLENHPIRFDISKFDLDFTFTESENTLSMSIEYNTDLFSKRRIDAMLHHYGLLLSAALQTSKTPVGGLGYVSEEEKVQCLLQHDLTETRQIEETVISLFEKQVLKTPHNVAVVFKNKRLSYHNLNRKANQLAHYLSLHFDISSDDRFGVCIARSEEMVVALLAILKTGAAYVPLDPEYPKTSDSTILKDSAVKAVLATKKEAFDAGDIPLIELDSLASLIGENSTSNLKKPSRPDDLAYVMFTSGSMGVPKGVMVDHKNVVSLVHEQTYVPLTTSSRLLQTGALTFDATIIEIWGMLLNGGQLHLMPKDEMLNFSRMKKHIQENRINIIWFTSPFFNAAVDVDLTIFEGMETLMVGGDRLSPYYINQVRNAYPNVNIVNLYGPTENTTFSTHYSITENHDINIPLGNALPGRAVYVLDGQHRPVPEMVIGEIYLSGLGLSRGYMNQPELTGERFVRVSGLTKTLYRTGDLGYTDYKGLIHYVGRVDRQLKISGYRIEPAEIDEHIKAFPSIKGSYTIGMEYRNEKCLVSYYSASQELAVNELRAYLSKKLPKHSVPQHFVKMEAIPLTPNGKIAVDELPVPDLSLPQVSERYLGPSNTIEKGLISIWSKLLEKEGLGIRDNFFDVGGNSLIATRLISRISKTWGVDIELKTLFSHPTIEEISAIISKSEKSYHRPIERSAPQPNYPATHAQQRLWTAHHLEDAPMGYNVSSAYTILGDLESNVLKEVFFTLVRRHESLRTVFTFSDDKVSQKILEPSETPLPFVYEDLRGKEDVLQYARAVGVEEAEAAFDLETGPLFRVRLLRVEGQHFKFFFTLHHIVCDAWSLEILMKEFLHLYTVIKAKKRDELPPMNIQYKDYAVWLEKLLKSEYYDKAKAFWKKRLTPVPTKLDFPVDYPTVRPNSAGGEVTVEVDHELFEAIRTIAKNHNASVFMVLLSVLNALLYRYTNKGDVIVGSPVAGRVHLDLENQVGLYTNTLLLKTMIMGNLPFSSLLLQVRDEVLQAYDYQLYPFDALLSEMETPDGQLPVEVMVQHLKTGITGKEMAADQNNGLDIRYFSLDRSPKSLVLLYFMFVEVSENLQFTIKYDAGRLSQVTALNLGNRFVKMIESIVEDIDLPIKNIALEERPTDGMDDFIGQSFDFDF